MWITLCETLEIDRPVVVQPGDATRWAVQVEGEEDDISDLERSLNGSVNDHKDLVISRLAGVAILASHEWDGIDDPSEIAALATAALDDCTACLNLLNVCGPLKVGTIYHFKSSSRCVLTRYSKNRVTVKKALADRASPLAFKTLLRMSRQIEWLAYCLPMYSKEPDFFDVYKAVEAIRRACGGEKAMKARADVNGGKLANIKTVADYHRHIQPPDRARPKPFYSLQECVDTVTGSIDALLRSSDIGQSKPPGEV